MLHSLRQNCQHSLYYRQKTLMLSDIKDNVQNDNEVTKFSKIENTGMMESSFWA